MSIRELFIDWLTSSRYIKSLESARIEQRQLYESLLADKQEQIKHLRTQLANLDAECRVLRVQANPRLAGIKLERTEKPPVKPAFDGPTDWLGEVQRIAAANAKEQQDGTHGIGREEVHQQAANDGASAKPGPATVTAITH